MINLLPLEDKQILRAGRTNWLLVRYVIFGLGVSVTIIVITVATWLYLNTIRTEALARVAINEDVVNQLAADKVRVDEFESNLTIAKQILSKEVNYSTIVLRYASVIPNGTIIDSIVLEPSIIGTPSTFTARAKSEQKVLELKDALNASSYFRDVKFSEIGVDRSDAYRYSVTISLIVDKSILEDTTGASQ